MSKRVHLVSILLILVGLSGCIGESESSGSTQSSTQVVALEIINDCENAEVHVQSTTLANGSMMETIIGINVSVYHAIYTPNVANLAFGYDINLDGNVDVFSNITRGTTNLSIPLSEIALNNGGFFLTTIAGVATVSGGLSTQLVHLSDDCESLSDVNFAQLTIYRDDFTDYRFSVDDATGTPTAASGEDLVYVSLDQGDDLSWATVIVQMSNGGAFTECTNPGQAVDTGCAVTDSNDDGKWAFGEDITISEGSDDICSTACTVQVKVLDRASNKLIYESTETNLA